MFKTIYKTDYFFKIKPKYIPLTRTTIIPFFPFQSKITVLRETLRLMEQSPIDDHEKFYNWIFVDLKIYRFLIQIKFVE